MCNQGSAVRPKNKRELEKKEALLAWQLYISLAFYFTPRVGSLPKQWRDLGAHISLTCTLGTLENST